MIIYIYWHFEVSFVNRFLFLVFLNYKMRLTWHEKTKLIINDLKSYWKCKDQFQNGPQSNAHFRLSFYDSNERKSTVYSSLFLFGINHRTRQKVNFSMFGSAVHSNWVDEQWPFQCGRLPNAVGDNFALISSMKIHLSLTIYAMISINIFNLF